MSGTHDIPKKRVSNPYVGPRAFRKGETLYARDDEVRELTDLLIARRVVLLHAPSGAGKTSLLQAGVIPLLEDENFAPTPALRVNTPPPDANVRNRYVYSVAAYISEKNVGLNDLAQSTLQDIVGRIAAREPEKTPVLVFDQFEEILLLDPTDHQNQRAFFEDLGDALEETNAWVLLSMREDYIGGLDRFVRYVPGHLSSTYRLDFLDRDGAKEAIQGPAREPPFEVEFEDDAATEVVRRLATMKIQTPLHGEREVEAPYVHPYQLQVVCNALWRKVRREKRDGRGGFREIKLKDVRKHANVPRALQDYYAGAVADVARRTKADEGVIRRWFERELITPQNFRQQTLTAPQAGPDPEEILRALEAAFLIRSDMRAEARWYELSHDQLINAVRVNNESWAWPNLSPWQIKAKQWETNREPDRLLAGYELILAQREAQTIELSHGEKAFLEASAAEAGHGLLTHARARLGLALTIAVVEAVVIAILILSLVLVLTH